MLLFSINIKIVAQCIDESGSPQWNPIPSSSASSGLMNYPFTNNLSATVTITNGGSTTFVNLINGLNVASFSKSALGIVEVVFSTPISKSNATQSFKIFNIGPSEAQIITAKDVNNVSVDPTFANSDKVNINGNEIVGNSAISGTVEFSFLITPIKTLRIEPKSGVSGALNISFQKICADVPTPVELTFFQAKTFNYNVKLNWQTASEKNNKGFEIERSVDAKTWENIGAIKGHGESNIIVDYTFEDKRPLSILTYYRLKQVDFDGKASYSKVVNVDFNKKKGEFSIFPNPMNSKTATINVDEDLLDGVLIVINSIGLMVKKENINSKILTLDLSNLSNGMYVFMVQKAQNKSLRKVIIAD